MNKLSILILLISLAYVHAEFPMEVTTKILGTSGGSGSALVNNCDKNGGPATITLGIQFSSTEEPTPVYYSLYDTYTEEWSEYKLLCTVGASGKTCNLVLPLRLGGRGNGVYSADFLKLKVEREQYQYINTISLSFEHIATALEQQILEKVKNARRDISVIEYKGGNRRCNTLNLLEGIRMQLTDIEDMVAQCQLQEGFAATVDIEGILLGYKENVESCVLNWERFDSIMKNKMSCDIQFDKNLQNDIEVKIATGIVEDSDFYTLSSAVNSYNERCKNQMQRDVGDVLNNKEENKETVEESSSSRSETSGTPICGAAIILLGALYGAFRKAS